MSGCSLGFRGAFGSSDEGVYVPKANVVPFCTRPVWITSPGAMSMQQSVGRTGIWEEGLAFRV